MTRKAKQAAQREKWDRQTELTMIAHELAGITMLDDQQLEAKVHQLTRDLDCTGREIANIIKFAIVVARDQIVQLESLPSYRAIYPEPH